MNARIWLSASIPPAAPEQVPIENFLRALSLELFRRGLQLVHGSHPTTREHLLTAAAAYKEQTGSPAPLTLAVSQYFAKSRVEYGIDLERWGQLCDEPPIVTREGIGASDGQVRANSLEILRDTLLEQCNVMIALGGNWWHVAADRAGVPREIELAESARLPLFLLGSLGGATKDYLAARPELLRRCHNGMTEEQNIALFSITDMGELATKIVDQISRLPIRRRDSSAGRPFRILSLDGGGIRGVYTAAVLAHWEERTGRRVADHFDLIAGTSTGGIIAIGLGLGLPAAELLKFYVERGPEIFNQTTSSQRAWLALRHWWRSRYDRDVLERCLREAYSTAPRGFATLDDSACRLVIPYYNAAADRTGIFRTSHDPRDARLANQDPVVAALATAAAPTYFNPLETRAAADANIPIEAVDGGVWANQPCTVAVAEAVDVLGVPLERLHVLSVGTTFFPTLTGQPLVIDADMVSKLVGIPGGFWAAMAAKVFWQDTTIRGKLGWVANIAELLMKTQSQATDHACRSLLRDRFLRVDDASTAREMDDPRNIRELVGLGVATAGRHLDEVRRRFLNGVPANNWH